MGVFKDGTTAGMKLFPKVPSNGSEFKEICKFRGNAVRFCNLSQRSPNGCKPWDSFRNRFGPECTLKREQGPPYTQTPYIWNGTFNILTIAYHGDEEAAHQL